MTDKKTEGIKEGTKVKIHYTGKLDDGTVFDSSEGREPLQFQVGAQQVIPGFENAVKGMKKGEEKEFKLEPKDAYGDRNPLMVQKVPKDQLPAEVKKGAMLLMQAPTGQQFPVVVAEVDDKEVTLDMNHPLAGKALNFKIKIDDFEHGKLEKKEHCHDDGCGCCGH